ncbi:MAG: hypothetical protein FOGNACKC_03022 [Anaerolineae bacterium]|nr:hypothetical protein [Anaerolineae bacterium]
MKIYPYTSNNKTEWDDFICNSKNGTFLFYRDYMDYHADRFRDHSLIVSNEQDQIIAVLPANARETVLISHEGLTYGGFIVNEKMSTPLMLETFEASFQYLAKQGFTQLIYKTIPHIYHSTPAEEDTYALFRHNAELYRRDVLTVVNYCGVPLKFQQRRLRSIKKAKNHQLQVKESNDFSQFWAILTANLSNKYGINPVHTIDEIKLLAHQFPAQIKLFAAYKEDTMQAGAVVYLSPNVCHVQYNATTLDGANTGALDLVIDHLINVYRPSKRYFDFGISTEDNGCYLNIGLVDYKEGFGARTVTHDFYKIDLTHLPAKD